MGIGRFAVEQDPRSSLARRTTNKCSAAAPSSHARSTDRNHGASRSSPRLARVAPVSQAVTRVLNGSFLLEAQVSSS
jgi:hypothetical protein